jgi:hypothetical protein
VTEQERLAAALEYQQAQQPARMNPNLAAQGARGRENMMPPTSIMDERYPAFKRNQEDAEKLMLGLDIVGSAIPLAGPAMKGAKILGQAAAPQIAQALENYTFKTGMALPMVERQAGRTFAAPQDKALRLAQERASLPVEQGGLGLPKENTPEMRAQAMGFDTPAYHATNVSNITKFDLGKSNRGEGISVAINPENAQSYGNIIYPLKIDQQKIFDPTNKDQIKELKSYVENLIQQQKPYDKDSLSFYPFTSKKVLENLANPETGAYYLENEIISKSLKDLGYSGSIGMESGQSQLKMFNPDQIRSRFAAFDPFRRNAAIAAAMGVAAPDLLAKEKKK